MAACTFSLLPSSRCRWPPAAQTPALDDADVRLAWYADVLDPASDAKCVTPLDTTDIHFGRIARGFLASLGTAMERDG